MCPFNSPVRNKKEKWQICKPLDLRSAHDLFLVVMKTNRKKESKQNTESSYFEKGIRSEKVNQAVGCNLNCTEETDAGAK